MNITFMKKTMRNGANFWRNYMERWFGEDLIADWKKSVEIDSIASGSGRKSKDLGLAVYDTGDAGHSGVFFILTPGVSQYTESLFLDIY